MNLVAPKGLLHRLTPKQVRAQLGLSVDQMRRFVEKGALRRRGEKPYSFFLKDVNEFVVRFNAGEID